MKCRLLAVMALGGGVHGGGAGLRGDGLGGAGHEDRVRSGEQRRLHVHEYEWLARHAERLDRLDRHRHRFADHVSRRRGGRRHLLGDPPPLLRWPDHFDCRDPYWARIPSSAATRCPPARPPTSPCCPTPATTTTRSTSSSIASRPQLSREGACLRVERRGVRALRGPWISCAQYWPGRRLQPALRLWSDQVYQRDDSGAPTTRCPRSSPRITPPQPTERTTIGGTDNPKSGSGTA